MKTAELNTMERKRGYGNRDSSLDDHTFLSFQRTILKWMMLRRKQDVKNMDPGLGS